MKYKQKTFLTCTFLCLVFLIPLIVQCKENVSTKRTVDEIINDASNGIPYREMVYANVLQKRFSLPVSGVTNLEKGLMGIALEIRSSSTGSGLLRCGLHLYVDPTTVKLDLPFSNNGALPRTNYMPGHFVTDRYILNEADATYRINILDAFANRLLIQSVSYPEGVTNSMSIKTYDTNLYPGISYLYFSPACNALNYEKSGPVKIWLNKNSNVHNLPSLNNKGNAKNYYEFSMPERLSRSFLPIIQSLQEYNKGNRRNFSNFMKKYRAILDTEKGFGIPK